MFPVSTAVSTVCRIRINKAVPLLSQNRPLRQLLGRDIGDDKKEKKERKEVRGTEEREERRGGGGKRIDQQRRKRAKKS